jgi:Glycosyltransferase
MKICYVANSASSHTAKWATYFAELGHEVHVISHSNVEIQGTFLHYINYNLRNFPIKAHQVHSLIKKINPDILHAQQANTCGLYAVTAKGYSPIVSAWGSDILIGPERSMILKKITQYVIKNSYFMTSDSEYMTEKIIKLGGNPEKVYTFPMGVEDSIFEYKHDFSLDNGILNIVSTRRLEKLYNIDVIIDGFNEALKVDDGIFLTVAANGVEMESLKNKIVEYGIQDKVRFIGDYNHEDVGNILSKNSVFISIPSSDSTSVSLLEAMCCGLYPIVSDLPANKEWVIDGDNGLIIKTIDTNSIKEAILWCRKHIENIKAVSDKNRNIIKNRALWSNNAKVVENLYNRLFTLKK